MELKVQDVIRDSMNLIGAIQKDEPATPDELVLGLRVLNMMIDKWSTERLLLRSTASENFLLSTGKGSYTIGPSGDFNTSKPIKIVDAFIRDGNGIDMPVDIVTKSVFDSYNDKLFSSARPLALCYDPGPAQGSTLGTIYVYYNPDGATTYRLFIDCDKYLSEFADIQTVVSFEPAYYEALVYNLAVRLFRYYHKPDKQVPVDIVSLAKNSKTAIKTMNAQPVVAKMDIPGKISIFNIYNDTNV